MTLYKLSNVTAGYGDGVVLEGLDLAIGRGVLAGLVGPNGSGKTTLLNLLAFLELPGGGSIAFDGEVVDGPRLEGCRRRVGFVMQNPYLVRGSVLDNVALGLKFRGMGRVERGLKAVAALERVGLVELAGRPADALSGGEARRVALARALALEPDVVLLDEPTANLDDESCDRIEEVIDGLTANGSTVVVASHDRGWLRRMEANAWRLSGGRVEPERWENVFGGRLSSQDPSSFETENFPIAVTGVGPDARWVEVKPNEVILSKGPIASSARNHLTGAVAAVEEAGEPGSLRITLDCGAPVTAIVTRRSWEELGLAEGGKAVASFKASVVRSL